MRNENRHFGPLIVLLLIACATPAAAAQMPLLDKCEAALRQRLVLPDSYEPISISPMSERRYQLDDFTRMLAAQGTPLDDDQVAKLRAARAAPVRYSLSILYRAASQFGGTANGSASCDFISPDGAAVDAVTIDTVEVNGITSAAWAADHSIPR